jgi:hypothetical protein
MKQPAIIIDRDGTLASVDYCAPKDSKDDESWNNFNAALRFDAPVPVVAALLRSVRPGVARIMTSGRMEGDWPGDRRRRIAMMDWIVKHQLPIDELFMREGGDYRVDSVLKDEIYETKIAPRYDVKFVIDDRPQVCDMWRKKGLHVLQVTDPGILPPICG